MPVGVAFAHHLNTAMPFAIIGGYSSAGSAQQTAYIGFGGEF
jgi:hypothetical protein